MFEIKLQNALTRIFPDSGPSSAEISTLTALSGETVSFQAALFGDLTAGNIRVQLETAGPAAQWSHVRWVGLAPSEYPCHPDPDQWHERTTPGLFPDPLEDPEDHIGRCVAGQWRSAWIDLDVPDSAEPGEYALSLHLRNTEGSLLCQAAVTLTVLKGSLPRQKLIHTEWFHTDCLADYYGVVPRSERWWEIVESFAACAAKRGINMLLTPIFTPPLDTAVGAERTTVQLVDIYDEDGAYRFDFTDLDRWVRMCQSRGIRYFEMPHLFTQWGARFAPKILVRKDGVEEKRFGWHTPATSQVYRTFLAQFLPALRSALARLGIESNTAFHISDEPGLDHLSEYKAASDMVRPYLQGCRIMDALSSYELYEQGIVQGPVVATDHILPFLVHDVPDLWAYYCTGQGKNVSNRFFGMPLDRCRVLGLQLYCHKIHGFLHWGFNFYNSGLSLRHIDPYRVTDADCCLPSGDPFIVYPGADGRPVESMRLMAMDRAMEDLRLLECLESLEGRDAVLSLIEEVLGQSIAFDSYPNGPEYLPTLFDRVRHEIAKRI